MTAAAGAPPAPSPRLASRLLIRDVRPIDKETGRPGRPCHVLVENGWISALSCDPITALDASVVEAGGGVMVEGLVDCHVRLFEANRAGDHEAGLRGGFVARPAGEGEKGSQGRPIPAAHDIEEGFGRLANMGAAGFAAVCDVSGVDAGIKDLLARAIPSAPRLLVASEAIGSGAGAEGRPGLGRARALCPCCEPPVGSVLSSAERILTERAWAGLHRRVDRVRVGLSRFDPLLKRPMDDVSVSTEALAAIAGEASRQNGILTVLAHTPSAITRAVEAGAHAVEEGSLLDRRSADLMAARGTVLIPCLSKLARHVETLRTAGSGGTALDPALRLAEAGFTAVELARRSGVKIAFGSGSDGRDKAAQMQEWSLMGEILGPWDLIAGATTVGRDLLRLSRVSASPAVGRHADFLVLDGDPFVDIGALGRVLVRVQDGSGASPA